MTIVHFSKTGNVKAFIRKLNQDYFPQLPGTQGLLVDGPLIIVTYTSGFGEIPLEVEQFCENHQSQIKYIIASGNRNWGKLFANSGALLAKRYNAELLYKFELSGSQVDLANIHVLLQTIKSEGV